MHRRTQHRSGRLSLLPVFLSLAIGPIVIARPVHSYINEHGVLTYFNVPEKHVDIDGSCDRASFGLPCFVAGEPVDVNKVAAVMPEKTAAKLNPRLVAAESRYGGYINKHATAFAVDPALVRAVIATESGFNPIAVSRRGAVGLMQLIPSTARRFGVQNIFHPDQNIEGGVRYLRFLLDTFNNDLKLALAAYNAGENVVRRLGGIPNYPETVTYVNRITARYGDTYRPYVSAPAAMGAVEPATAANRIYRIVDSLGNIIYTNRPTLTR